ncbi:MAG: bifunctional DNA primase/polymerase, partial [Candidatus Staskawiczbacteria bacterium]
MENVNNIISLVASGLSIIPIHEGGKEPAYWLGKTEPFINLRATNAQVMEWVKRGVKSWGLFSGPISGNVATLDFDEKWQIGLYDAFYAKLSDEQKAYVDKCIKNKTRNNGTHIICRTDTTQKSTDLAKGLRLAKNKKPSRDHDAIEGMQTLIETRGEGNYVLIPPSPGYETLQGDLMSVPNIGDDMWEQLCDIARTFNEVTEEPETEYEHKQTNSSNADLPGNRFNEIATWKEILEPYGWIEVYPNGWARPGKGKNDGISATTNHDDKPILYVFSSNAQPFKGPHGDKKGTGYTKFHAYTLLNHNGDFSVSAKEILKNENITNGNKSDYISGKVQENNKKEE